MHRPQYQVRSTVSVDPLFELLEVPSAGQVGYAPERSLAEFIVEGDWNGWTGTVRASVS